jgi:hypothetical protein
MGIQIKFTNGEYERHKARNVDLQRKNVDFFTSFSPSASYVTIRLVLALTELPHWYGVDLDTTGAFISAPLPSEEQVHLKNILGYDLPKGKCLRRSWFKYGKRGMPGLAPVAGRPGLDDCVQEDACEHTDKKERSGSACVLTLAAGSRTRVCRCRRAGT